ncbi:hypothetical protein MIND_00896500 [Mycena indigotica]|uniref:Acetyl-CoA synthetase-like protein n=1 Tax=Mycena indigotica TaxID=2126181 RepID=A0A8H6SH14_9AGAR|nr:uncharacterized protein MIND_00896500 [Mycena indigotica]KAF7299465.1 hypothetical protein MIND_00896500 [Mycena indigotica]
MAEFTSLMPAPHIPDDVTVPQFLFDYEHPIRMTRKAATPWIIDAATGKTYGKDELSERTWNLANGLSLRYSLGAALRILVCGTFLRIFTVPIPPIVGILSSNHVDFAISVWAAHRLGSSVFTLNPTFNAEEILPSIRDMKPALLFVHPMALPAATAAAASVGLSTDRIILLATTDKIGEHALVTELVELGFSSKETHKFKEYKLAPGEGKTKTALCFPSSGTTGVPKMAALPHAAIIANVLQNAAWDMGLGTEPIPVEERRFRPGDVSLAALPFFHIFGLLINLQYHLFCGMTAVILPKFDFRDFLAAIKTYQVNQLSLVPPIMVLFSKHPAVVAEDLRSIRVIYAGGAPVNLHFVQEMAKLMPNAVIEQSLGMTEVSGIVAMPPLDRQVSTGSGGCLLPGNSARVMKTETGADGDVKTALAAPGEPGELYIRGPSIATHYVNNEKMCVCCLIISNTDVVAAQRRRLWTDGFGQGIKCTLTRKERCMLWTESRHAAVYRGLVESSYSWQDFIKVRAFQVAPAELEARLAASADVADCCVVPVPDEFNGQLPKAYVVLSASALERVGASADAEGEKEKIKEALIKDIADHKAKYKGLGGGVEFIDAIPRNAAGKLLRRVLREKAAYVI